MRHFQGEDEVYVTTVVARCPAGQGRAELTHRLLSQAAVQSMTATTGTAGYQPGAPRREPDRRGTGRWADYGRRPQADRSRLIYLLLAGLCLAGAGFTLYLALV